MFDALLQFEDILKNPLFIAFIVSLIVDILGYIENKARNAKIGFDKGMLLETIAKYEVFIPLLSLAFPLEKAVVGAFLIDVITRVIKKLKT
jgi:predicted permease